MSARRGLVEGLRNGRTVVAKLNEREPAEEMTNVEDWPFLSVGSKKVE